MIKSSFTYQVKETITYCFIKHIVCSDGSSRQRATKPQPELINSAHEVWSEIGKAIERVKKAQPRRVEAR